MTLIREALMILDTVVGVSAQIEWSSSDRTCT